MTAYKPELGAVGGAPSDPGDGAAPTATIHRRTWASRLSVSNIGAVYVLLLIIVIFSIWDPSTFPKMLTVKQILNEYSITALASLAILVPLSAATFDLSFAYTMSLSGVSAAHFIVTNHLPTGLAMLLGVLVGLIVGFINGFVVVVMKIDSFIGTLGTGSLVQAFITFVTNDNPIDSLKLSGSFTTVSQHLVGGLQLVVYWALALAIILWLFMEYSSTGRRLYATGFNPDAARLAGIRVDRLRFCSLLVSSAIAGFAGVMLASSLSSGSPSAGTNYLLPAFAASFVGATQFKRDRMNAWGTIVAVLMLGTGIVGLGLSSAPDWAQQMFTGIVLLTALAFSGLQHRSLFKGNAGLARIGEAITSLLRRGEPAA